MTTHKIQKNEDGSYTYRDHRIQRRADKLYFVGWIRSIEPAPTLKTLAANIDAYIAAEEKAWTPVLRKDGTYCSPRCGHKCTKAAHDEAQRNARLLVAVLGLGWKPRVWENVGWHFEARVNSTEVDCYVTPPRRHDDSYTCYLNTEPQFITRSTDPREAFKQARRLLAAHIADLREVEGVLAKP